LPVTPSHDAGKDENVDTPRAVAFEYARALVDGGSGGINVVDEQNSTPAYPLDVTHCESSDDVAAAFAFVQSHLWWGGANAGE
jgi:hypothetical protein